MRIGLYFGSFNPVHNGHLIIASYAAYNTDLDKVWLVVSPQNPLKPSATLLNEHDRYHLVELAVRDEPKLKASNVEFSLPKPSYTVDTLTFLSEKYPDHQFSVIMGSDSFKNLAKWKNTDQILANYPIYVYNRPHHELPSSTSGAIIILDAPLLDISSSLIRRLIRERKSIRFFLPDSVATYITDNNYYRKAIS
ncbi:MAG TPA: nicotinate (nicotinamide) nucleotide adenylyltransferase [Chitinophagaceae bacterium]|nr:nicotinate (nicotinamide) nucleotide adenylyltransferase [Chitinophagaceae bacterium]